MLYIATDFCGLPGALSSVFSSFSVPFFSKGSEGNNTCTARALVPGHQCLKNSKASKVRAWRFLALRLPQGVPQPKVSPGFA